MPKIIGGGWNPTPKPFVQTLSECVGLLGWTYSITEPNPEFKGKKPDIGTTVELAMSPENVSLLERTLLGHGLGKGVALRLPSQQDWYTLDVDDVRAIRPYDGNSSAPHLPRTAYFLKIDRQQPVIVMEDGRIQVNAAYDEPLIGQLSLIPDHFDDD